MNNIFYFILGWKWNNENSVHHCNNRWYVSKISNCWRQPIILSICQIRYIFSSQISFRGSHFALNSTFLALKRIFVWQICLVGKLGKSFDEKMNVFGGRSFNFCNWILEDLTNLSLSENWSKISNMSYLNLFPDETGISSFLLTTCIKPVILLTFEVISQTYKVVLIGQQN